MTDEPIEQKPSKVVRLKQAKLPEPASDVELILHEALRDAKKLKCIALVGIIAETGETCTWYSKTNRAVGLLLAKTLEDSFWNAEPTGSYDPTEYPEGT